MSRKKKAKGSVKNKNKRVVERILNAKKKNGSSATNIELNRYISKENDIIRFESNLRRLMKYPAVRNSLDCFAKTPKQLGVNGTYAISSEKLISLYLCSFEVCKEKITRFLCDTVEYEHLFLSGKYEEAEKSLEALHDNCGTSLWYIRSKLLLLKYSGRLDDLQEFYSGLKSQISNKSMIEFVDIYFAMLNSTDTSLSLETYVIKNIREFKDAGALQLVSFYSQLYLPAGIYSDRDITYLFSEIQRFPVIDQYMMLVDWFVEAASDPEHYDLTEEFVEITLGRISSITSDRRIDALLNGTGSIHSNMSVLGEHIVNDYASGRYEDVLINFFSSLEKLKSPPAYINIVAKSCAYAEKEVPLNDSLIGEFISRIVEIYQLSASTSNAFSELHRMIILTVHLGCSHSLIVALIKACQSQFSDEEISKSCFRCSMTQSEFTPLTKSMSDIFGENKNGLTRFVDLKNSNLPIYRQLKDTAYGNIKNGIYDENLIDRLEECEPLNKEFYEIKISSLISAKMSMKAIEFSSEILIKLPETYICVPLEKLIQIIIDNSYSSIESSIICYFYCKHISSEKSYLLNEIVEDFVLDSGKERPSQILEDKTSAISDAEIFFYEKICTRKVIDFLACFKNTVDLASERLKIIELLGCLENNTNPNLRDESDKIVEEIVVETGVAKIDSNKIEIDADGIAREKSSEMDLLVSSYWIFPEQNNAIDSYVIVENVDEDKVQQGLVVGDRKKTLVRMYDTIQIAFLYDENHGLDKSISMEIRHGFFSNLMRSRLEERHILLESDSKNKYKSSDYWREIHNFLRPAISDEIVKNLAKFSNSFNKLLRDAENHLRVSISFENDGSIFSFIITPEDIDALEEHLEKKTSGSEVITYLIDKLWMKTEECLYMAREYMNEEFKDSVEKLFLELTKDINETKGGASLVELSDAVMQARNGIKEDIKTVSEWLRRGGNACFDSIALPSVIDIAIKSFRDIKGVPIDISLAASNCSRMVDGKHVKPIILALINLLDNCLKYGKVKESNPIEIVFFGNNQHFNILVSNVISDSTKLSLSLEKLRDLKSIMIRDGSSHLLRSEGGTGLKKSYHYLKTIDQKYDINLHLKNNSFVAEICYA